MDVQALGVELITDIRCLTCGKVLAGRISDEYDRLIKIVLRDINESMPQQLTPKEKDELSIKIIGNKIKEIFQKLGIKRYCCMNNLQYKSQLLVGAPSPQENTIIDRQNMADKGMKRSITRINLSTSSRVPGNSGFSMVSLPGEEDYGPEWKIYMEKFKRELSPPSSGNQFEFSKGSSKLISTTQQLPLGFNIRNTNVPIVTTGNTTTINPKYLDMLSEPTYIGGPSPESEEQIETISSFSQMSISEPENVDNNNFRDIMDFEITAPGEPDDLSNRFF